MTEYEFLKVNDHKSHLLMNCTDLEKLGSAMDEPSAKEWDQKTILMKVYVSVMLLKNLNEVIKRK